MASSFLQQHQFSRRLRPEEAPRVRRSRRQPRLPRQEGHREGQHRQQERRKLRLRFEKLVLSSAGVKIIKLRH